MRPHKSKTNLKKHKIPFDEAATALGDPMAVTGSDPDHSVCEERYITFGFYNNGSLLVVSHTEREDTIRIISARKASKGEQKLYEEG